MLPGDKGAAVDRSGRDPHHQPGRDALLQKDIQSPGGVDAPHGAAL